MNSNARNNRVTIGGDSFQFRIGNDGDQIIEILDADGNKLTRKKFNKKYKSLIDSFNLNDDSRNNEKPKILVDGDSWANILWPWSSVAGFHPNFVDMMKLSRKYNIKNFGWPGQPISTTVTNRDYKISLKSGIYKFFIASGGGTDVIGQLRYMLKPQNETDPNDQVETWFYKSLIDSSYDRIHQNYIKLAEDIRVWSRGKTRLVMHGYDYPIPRVQGPWIGNVLISKGYDLQNNSDQVDKITQHIIDRLYEKMELITTQYTKSILIDVRDVVQNRWTDEIHTNRAASDDIAKLVMNRIDPFI